MAYDLTKVQRIDLIKSKPSHMIPFDYQQTAVKKLNTYFSDDSHREDLGWRPGLLVMPTGSGKTATTVWWMPFHNLDEIKNLVIDQWFNKKTNMCSSIAWTKKPVSRYWGMCYFADNRININCVLDSPDVPVEVMKFLIYHELLHADGLHQHDQEFRAREHLYPNWQEWDHFLDTMQERFDLEGVSY